MTLSVTASNSLTNTPPLVVLRAAKVVAAVAMRAAVLVPTPVTLSSVTLLPLTVPAVWVMLPADISTVSPVVLPTLAPSAMLPVVVLRFVLPVLTVLTKPLTVIVPPAVTS